MTTPAQPSLFAGNGQVDVDAALRAALKRAFRKSSKSRDAIADEMSRLLSVRVTAAIFNDFTSQSHRGHRFPAAWLPAFCVVVGDCTPLRLLAEAAGFRMVGDEEMMLIAYARATLEKKDAAEKIEALEPALRKKEQ